MLFSLKKKHNTYRRNHVDYTMFLLVIICVVIGLVMLYSTSAYNGQVKFSDKAYYLKKQFFATSIGLLLMYIVSEFDYHMWEKFSLPAYVVSMILSALVLVVGSSYNGSKRWLSIGGLSFQPAEFAKVAVILFLAWYISHSRKKVDSIFMMLKVIFMVMPIVALVGTNNLSTAIIILGIAVVMIFVASSGYRQFILIGAIGCVFVAVFLSIEAYRLERLMIWRNPEKYEKGYQTLQGLFAIGSGGLFGTGLENSMQKLGFVPEAQNDMIFSIICEETGLCGAVILIIIFVMLIYRFLLTAQFADDLFGTLVASGILTHIGIQVILNIAVVTNTIPNTGITLPFISYGGTSVMFLLTEMGLALNISKCRHLE